MVPVSAPSVGGVAPYGVPDGLNSLAPLRPVAIAICVHPFAEGLQRSGAPVPAEVTDSSYVGWRNGIAGNLERSKEAGRRSAVDG